MTVITRRAWQKPLAASRIFFSWHEKGHLSFQGFPRLISLPKIRRFSCWGFLPMIGATRNTGGLSSLGGYTTRSGSGMILIGPSSQHRFRHLKGVGPRIRTSATRSLPRPQEPSSLMKSIRRMTSRPLPTVCTAADRSFHHRRYLLFHDDDSTIPQTSIRSQ